MRSTLASTRGVKPSQAARSIHVRTPGPGNSPRRRPSWHCGIGAGSSIAPSEPTALAGPSPGGTRDPAARTLSSSASIRRSSASLFGAAIPAVASRTAAGCGAADRRRDPGSVRSARGFHHRAGDGVGLLDRAVQQHARAQRVDPARNAVGVAIDVGEGGISQCGSPLQPTSFSRCSI